MADDQTQGSGNPLPRPGDPVPQGGLDPTQVFSAPPLHLPRRRAAPVWVMTAWRRPRTAASAAPPGTAATKEMGYDDEDLKILAEVKDYRFGSIAAKLSNEKIVTRRIRRQISMSRIFSRSSAEASRSLETRSGASFRRSQALPVPDR